MAIIKIAMDEWKMVGKQGNVLQLSGFSSVQEKFEKQCDHNL